MDVREKTTNDMRLIDANKLIKNGLRVSYGFDDDGVLLIPIGDVIRSIKMAKTVDAVPVVRCRECKHWKPSGSKAGNSFSDMEYIGGCEFTNYYRRESDFCSYGERKEGAD